MKTKVIALWVCALYFAVLFYNNMGYAIFGTLGLIRPGDTQNGMIEVHKATSLIQSFAGPLSRLTGFVGLGAVLLFSVALWFTVGLVKRGDRADER
ncbi:MAG: hypothetical protein ACKVYV_05825 [Limisphaerales bacterium]